MREISGPFSLSVVVVVTNPSGAGKSIPSLTDAFAKESCRHYIAQSTAVLKRHQCSQEDEQQRGKGTTTRENVFTPSKNFMHRGCLFEMVHFHRHPHSFCLFHIIHLRFLQFYRMRSIYF